MVLIGILLLAGCDRGGKGTSDGDRAADVTITVDNVGDNAWEVTGVEGATGVVDRANENGDNPALVLSVGTRYRVDNDGGLAAHPFGVRDSDGRYVLRQEESRSGRLEDDPGVRYEEDQEGITFTYTQSLADAAADYRCTVHPSMGRRGAQEGEQPAEGTPSSEKVKGVSAHVETSQFAATDLRQRASAR